MKYYINQSIDTFFISCRTVKKLGEAQEIKIEHMCKIPFIWPDARQKAEAVCAALNQESALEKAS